MNYLYLSLVNICIEKTKNKRIKYKQKFYKLKILYILGMIIIIKKLLMLIKTIFQFMAYLFVVKIQIASRLNFILKQENPKWTY